MKTKGFVEGTKRFGDGRRVRGRNLSTLVILIGFRLVQFYRQTCVLYGDVCNTSH